MKRQPIKSSSIVSAGFENGVLEIQFTSTAVYRYLSVPEEVWKAFLATDSKGAYFVCRIRDRFKFECVYRPPRKKEKTNGMETTQEGSHGELGKKAVRTAGRPEARTEKKKARIS